MGNNQNYQPNQKPEHKEEQTETNQDKKIVNKEEHNGKREEQTRRDSTKPEHEVDQKVRQPEIGKQTPGEKEEEGETEEERSTERRRVGDSDSDNEEIPGSRM